MFQAYYTHFMSVLYINEVNVLKSQVKLLFWGDQESFFFKEKKKIERGQVR